MNIDKLLKLYYRDVLQVKLVSQLGIDKNSQKVKDLEMLQNLLDRLTESELLSQDQKAIFNNYYRKRKTIEQVAEIINLSVRHTKRKKRNALDVLDDMIKIDVDEIIN